MTISKRKALAPVVDQLWLWIVISILAVSLIVAGCDQDQRYRILTFFFEQVPPPGYQPPDPNSIAARDIGMPGGASGESTARRSFAHEPIKDCDNNVCHVRQAKGQWALTKLSKEIPQLCYECHDNYLSEKGWVHGPVAVGDCLFCHNPHRSTNEHLLNEPQPVLCYKCHDEAGIIAIEEHPQEMTECTVCHSAHVASDRRLLKENIQVE